MDIFENMRPGNVPQMKTGTDSVGDDLNQLRSRVPKGPEICIFSDVWIYNNFSKRKWISLEAPWQTFL